MAGKDPDLGVPAAAKSVAIGTSAADIVATLPVHLNGTNVTNFKNIPDWYTTLSGKPTVHDFEQLTGQKVPPHHEFVRENSRDSIHRVKCKNTHGLSVR